MFQAGLEIGTYKLISKLGKGGFGEVWLAEKRSELVTKKVAIKLPLEDQVNLDAIRQEAELWEQASGHANVLPIIDADVINGQVVIVSEYANGGSLDDILKRDGNFIVQKAIEMTIGILNGLEFLHNRKIIHRDIKPQNILLQGETPRLADFGISRAMQTTAISSTIIGTGAYMSPESFEGKRSMQTDIWSVGVVLYQLLTGNLPFPQEHPSERMFAILQRDFEPLSNEIPSSLQQILRKALAKLPENRYISASEMREDLKRSLVISEQTVKFGQEQFPTPILQDEQETITSVKFQTPFVSQNVEINNRESVDNDKFEFTKFQNIKNLDNSQWITFIIGAVLFLVVLGGTGIYFLNNSGQNETAKVANTYKKENLVSANYNFNNGSVNNSTIDKNDISNSSSNYVINKNTVSSKNNPYEINNSAKEIEENVQQKSNKETSEKLLEQAKKNNTNFSTPSQTPNPMAKTPSSTSEKTPTPPPKTISGGVVNGKATSLPKPPYPAAARAVRAAGSVSVQVLIDETGRVVSASAASGHPLLQQAAVAAARQARFNPTILSGQPVKVSGIITYSFVP